VLWPVDLNRSGKQRMKHEFQSTGQMDRKKTLIISLIILITGGAVTTGIIVTEPTAKREGATRETAMLVEVTKVRKGTYYPTITATGTVEPEKDIILSPKVGGEVFDLSTAFTPGGYVKKDQTLLQIEQADYENILQMRKSDLLQAMADLDLEMGRQQIAQRDYQLLDEALSVDNESLVLREPQLNAVRSRVVAAQSAVKQAELDLERTSIKAPFDAHVLTRNANIGSQVSPGDNLGRLVGMDVYWVVVSVPLSRLRWLSFPGAGQERGSEVRIRNMAAWEEGEYRTGYLYKLIGSLDDQTRLARVLVSIPDPLAFRSENKGLPPLIIGSFMETSIMAREIPDVIRISRDYIRKDDTVWVIEEGKLRIREVDIVFTDAQFAYIANGLHEEDQVVTTNLTTVVDGASLRVESPDPISLQQPLPDTGRQN
jgi:RND family efflux transporter MFP subunit